MLPLDNKIFGKNTMQDPIITTVMNSSGTYSITILSNFLLSEEQLDIITSVVEADYASHYKPFDIAIDISVYTGFCDVNVIKTPNGFKVIIY